MDPGRGSPKFDNNPKNHKKILPHLQPQSLGPKNGARFDSFHKCLAGTYSRPSNISFLFSSFFCFVIFLPGIRKFLRRENIPNTFQSYYPMTAFIRLSSMTESRPMTTEQPGIVFTPGMIFHCFTWDCS